MEHNVLPGTGIRSGEIRMGMVTAPRVKLGSSWACLRGTHQQKNWFSDRGLILRVPFNLNHSMISLKKALKGCKVLANWTLLGKVFEQTIFFFPLAMDRLCKNFWETTQLKVPVLLISRHSPEANLTLICQGCVTT